MRCAAWWPAGRVGATEDARYSRSGRQAQGRMVWKASNTRRRQPFTLLAALESPRCSSGPAPWQHETHRGDGKRSLVVEEDELFLLDRLCSKRDASKRAPSGIRL
eukprot:365633-Chlamydomonas_euryale.AAC.7